LGLVGGGNDELGVVNEARVVGVDSAEHSLDFFVGHDSAVVLKISNLDLFHGEFTVTVGVEGLEDLGKVVSLLLAHELGGNESIGGLLKGDIRAETTEVVEGGHSKRSVNLESGELGDPRMLEGLGGRGSLLRVVGEEGADEALAVLRDGLPDAVIEGESTLAHLLHDILIRLTIEGRHTRKNDVSDDTGGPDIALLVVVLVEDLRGDIVGGSKLFVKVTVGVEDEGGTEVNDLDLIELLVLLKQNILGLKITVNNVSLMAVVDAGKDLLHQNCATSLSEFTTLKDFIEEFTTLADFSDKIVAFLIFEELVHFDDVWMVNFL